MASCMESATRLARCGPKSGKQKKTKAWTVFHEAGWGGGSRAGMERRRGGQRGVGRGAGGWREDGAGRGKGGGSFLKKCEAS